MKTASRLMLPLVLLSVAALAQSRDGVISINGGRTSVYLKARSQTVTPARRPDAGLITIFSNLGTGNNVYNGSVGSGILGQNVPNQLFPEWLASGFTPTADHVVTQIQVGVTYSEGPNGVILSINDDNNGVPGQPLKSWRLPNLPTFGTCCTLQTVNLATGIPVTHGKQYWIVLQTPAHNQGTWDVWNDNFNFSQGPTSNNIGSGWVVGGTQTQGAYGVFGQ